MTDVASSRVQRAQAWLAAPRDIAALVVFRVGLGLITLTSALRFLGYGWIDELSVRPQFHFSYWGFGWLPLPTPALIYGLFGAMAVLGAMVALGFCYRPAVALLFLLFSYLQLVDVATYLNHYYLVSLLTGLMVFIPAHRAASLDARLRPQLRAATLPAWCTYLLQFQVTVVYLNAGLAKATSDWLLHAQPMNLWLSARTALPLVGPYLDRPEVAYVAAWAGFLFDATIAFFLLWRRTRPFAYVAVLGFHAMTHLLFPPIGMFPVIMAVSALLFFDSSWPRRLWATVVRTAPNRAAEATPPIAVREILLPRRRWFALPAAVAGLFMGLQLVVPLRSHLYGGNVLWHEQGMRYSWRVMSRAKSGSVTFVVHQPQRGWTRHVSPFAYLTPLQEREMVVQPDLILQLAQHIARDFAARGHGVVEVRAEAHASLNGRPAEPLIDPAVDLSRQSDGLAAKPWITPAPETAPPLLHPLRPVARN